ncbi:MAG: hypothetical protein ChlgKO_12960 [Chlamydiales bacterium]
MSFSKVKEVFGEEVIHFAQIWILNQEVYSNWTGDQEENPALKEYNQTKKDIREKRNWREEHQKRLDVICAPKKKSSSKLPLAILAVGFFFTIGILYKYGKLDRLYRSAQDLGCKIAASRGCPFDRTTFYPIKKYLPASINRRLSL